MKLQRGRLCLFVLAFFTALLSICAFIVSHAYHRGIVARNPSYHGHVGKNIHPLTLLTILPLTWSAVWSYTAFYTSRRQQGARLPPAAKEDDTDRHRHRHCCCCVCSPWFNDKGPHPTFALVIELLLCIMLLAFGVRFGLMSSDYYNTSHLNCTLREKEILPRQPRTFFCQPSFWTLLGLEGCALILLLANTVTNLGLLALSCVSAHREGKAIPDKERD